MLIMMLICPICSMLLYTNIPRPVLRASTPAYKLAFRGTIGSPMTDFYPSVFTFTLEARDPKTGLTFARALCSTDHRGTVTTISAVPLNSDMGKLVSQN